MVVWGYKALCICRWVHMYVDGWMLVYTVCTGAGVWGRMSSVLIAFVRRWGIGGLCASVQSHVCIPTQYMGRE